MVTVFAMTQTQRSSDSADLHDCAEHAVRVTFVDVTPDDYDPVVAAAFGSLAACYEEIATALFDDDPGLTSRVAAQSLGQP